MGESFRLPSPFTLKILPALLTNQYLVFVNILVFFLLINFSSGHATLAYYQNQPTVKFYILQTPLDGSYQIVSFPEELGQITHFNESTGLIEYSVNSEFLGQSTISVTANSTPIDIPVWVFQSLFKPVLHPLILNSPDIASPIPIPVQTFLRFDPPDDFSVLISDASIEYTTDKDDLDPHLIINSRTSVDTEFNFISPAVPLPQTLKELISLFKSIQSEFCPSCSNHPPPIWSPYYHQFEDSNAFFSNDELSDLGTPIIPWTLNSEEAINFTLTIPGVTGLISDYAPLLYSVISKHNSSSRPFLLPNGLVNTEIIDLQGHRGSRGHRPESTFPSFEFALDALLPTLESDITPSSDHFGMLSHESYLFPDRCRSTHSTYDKYFDRLILEIDRKTLQSGFICDNLMSHFPLQNNSLDNSPVSVAYANSRNLLHPYIMPTVSDLFDFVQFYIDYYSSGPGSTHPEAALRSLNAQSVSFSLETKIRAFEPGMSDVGTFVESIVQPWKQFCPESSCNHKLIIQSFDFRSPLYVAKYHPQIQVSLLQKYVPSVGGTAWNSDNVPFEWHENAFLILGEPWPPINGSGLPSNWAEFRVNFPEDSSSPPQLKQPNGNLTSSSWILLGVALSCVFILSGLLVYFRVSNKPLRYDPVVDSD